jgi:WD40 repeat protein
VSSVAFSPDGTRIVSGAFDKTLRLWDARTGAELQILRGHDNYVYSVAFSPDGTRIVSGSNDTTLRLWDAWTGAELQILRGHEDFVYSAAFSLDGTRIVSGAFDKTLRLWDAQTGAELQILRVHESLATSVAFSPDGTRIVSGSDDAVRLWDAWTGKCLGVLNGTGDVKAIAAGTAEFRYRLMVHEQQSVIESSADGRPVAWFPAAFQIIATHRAGRLWAVSIGNHLTLVQLAGGVEKTEWR